MLKEKLSWRYFQESFVPLMAGGKHRPYVISECLHPDRDEESISYRTDNWKFIYHENGCHELYNLKDDPGETKNLAQMENKRLKQFESEVLSHIAARKRLRDECEMGKVRRKIAELKKLRKI